jgi:hypothetical protein
MLSYLSGQATSPQNISIAINNIKVYFQLKTIDIQEARDELKPIIGEKLANAAAIRLAYRGKAGSLICILAIDTYDLEVLSCCRNDISTAVSDFNWFWSQLVRIQNLTLGPMRAGTKTSTLADTMKDPIISGLVTTVVWALINGVTNDVTVASIVAGVVLLFYVVILHLWRVKKG